MLVLVICRRFTKFHKTHPVFVLMSAVQTVNCSVVENALNVAVTVEIQTTVDIAGSQVAQLLQHTLYICVVYREHGVVDSIKETSLWAELPSLCSLFSAQVNTVC